MNATNGKAKVESGLTKAQKAMLTKAANIENGNSIYIGTDANKKIAQELHDLGLGEYTYAGYIAVFRIWPEGTAKVKS